MVVFNYLLKWKDNERTNRNFKISGFRIMNVTIKIMKDFVHFERATKLENDRKYELST